MNNEINIPDHFPDANEENIKTTTRRRENYAVGRDLLAAENNDAIVKRLARERERQEKGMDEGNA